MNKWKKALVEVANLKGKDAKDRQETKFIEETDSIIQPKHTKLFLEVEALDLQASLQLLSYHAFKGNGPKKRYEEVSEKLMANVHGITNLIDRCLLTIGPSNGLKMHQLLQQMGRDVVHSDLLPMANLVALDMSYSNLESFGMSYGNPQQPV